MSEVGHANKVYLEHGGDKLTAESGGTISAESGSTVTLAGTNTLSGTNTISGATSISGAETVASGGSTTYASGSTLTEASGSKHVFQLQSKGTSYTVLASESGATFVSSAADVVFTLPATAAGLVYRFINGSVSAGTGLSVSPNASDKIMGSIGSVAITSADDKDLINTGATDVLGDSLTLMGDGVDGWYIIHGTGVWARQA